VAKFVPLYGSIYDNAFSIRKKAPQIAPTPWNCVTLPEDDQATVMGNMREKFGKDRQCGSGDMRADRQNQTDTHIRGHYNTSPPLLRVK